MVSLSEKLKKKVPIAWSRGLFDQWLSFNTICSNKYHVGTKKKKVIAIISGVKYNHSLGFIGYYICSPEYRGRGYGLKIFQYALEYLHKETPERNIGLDAVPQQVENYQKVRYLCQINAVT